MKVDEKSESGINERVFKLPEDCTEIKKLCDTLPDYAKINIDFEIQFYASGVRVIPIAIQKV